MLHTKYTNIQLFTLILSFNINLFKSFITKLRQTT